MEIKIVSGLARPLFFLSALQRLNFKLTFVSRRARPFLVYPRMARSHLTFCINSLRRGGLYIRPVAVCFIVKISYFITMKFTKR